MIHNVEFKIGLNVKLLLNFMFDINALCFLSNKNVKIETVMYVGSYSSFDVIPSKNTRASSVRTSANRLLLCRVCCQNICNDEIIRQC